MGRSLCGSAHREVAERSARGAPAAISSSALSCQRLRNISSIDKRPHLRGQVERTGNADALAGLCRRNRKFPGFSGGPTQPRFALIGWMGAGPDLEHLLGGARGGVLLILRDNPALECGINSRTI